MGIPRQLGEVVDKEFGQTHGIVIGNLADDGDFLGLERIEGIGRAHRTLEGVEEADAEVVLVAFGYVGIGCGNGHRRNFGFGKDRAAGHGQRAAPRAEHCVDFFLLGQNHGCVGGFYLVGFVVDNDQLDLLAQNGGVQLVGQLDAFEFIVAARAVGSGQRFKYTDFDYVGIGCGGRSSGAAAGTSGRLLLGAASQGCAGCHNGCQRQRRKEIASFHRKS